MGENQAESLTVDSIKPPKKSPSKKADTETRLQEAQLRGFDQDIDERKKYTSRLYWLMVGWLGAVFILLIFSGFRLLGFNLADSVLIAVISGTTVDIIGLFFVVTRYLFYRPATKVPKEEANQITDQD